MKETYKPYDTEESLDYFFCRPLASLIVKAVYNTSITPNQLTFVSLFFGTLSGFFFYFSGVVYIFLAILFFVMFVLFDCSDGQLARKRGTAGSMVGRTLDGLADNLVFLFIYIFSALKFENIPFLKLEGAEPYGWIIWAVVCVAAIGHSMQSSFFDYYRNRYIAYVNKEYKSEETSSQEIKEEIDSLKELKGKQFDRFILRIYFLYTIVQEKSNKKTSLVEQYEIPDNFGEIYGKRNRFLLRFWSILGGTTHGAFIIIFAMFDRMDLYFFFEVIVLNIYMMVLKIYQNEVISSIERQLKPREDFSSRVTSNQ